MSLCVIPSFAFVPSLPGLPSFPSFTFPTFALAVDLPCPLD